MIGLQFACPAWLTELTIFFKIYFHFRPLPFKGKLYVSCQEFKSYSVHEYLSELSLLIIVVTAKRLEAKQKVSSD